MTFGAFRLNTLSAAMAVETTSITATGGTVSYFFSSPTFYKLHSFTTTGATNFVVSAVSGTPTVDLLLVGGGGAGAGKASGNNAQGGGGGGAVLTQTSINVTAQTYSITVGAGGTGAATNATGASGTASTALGYTANGGGGGADGAAGTNGGGSSGTTSSFTATAGTYAYKGGNSFGSATGTLRAGGGGAGAGGAGVNAASAAGGNGGLAFSTTFTGGNTSYSPGGGGGANSGTAGVSGFGGGGQGGLGDLNTNVAGNTATAAFGAGGGGAAGTGGSNAVAGGSGRQGVAYIRYPVTPVSSLTYLSSVTIKDLTTITMPTVQAGDLAVLVSNAYNSTTTLPTQVNPSGWTLITGNSIATTLGSRSNAYYKVCNGTESGTSITTMSYTSTSQATLIIYRPNIPISLVQNVVSVGLSASDSAINSKTFSLSSPTSGPFIGMAHWASTGSVTVRTSTVTSTREIANSTNQYIQLFESAATNITNPYSDGTISIADYGTNILQCWILQIY
jgi:hypothetical protein